jgi:hypothetical protein
MALKFTPNRSVAGIGMLSVVKGEKGDTGDTGATGATGSTGATGPGYTATSTTSNAIASSGSKSFTTQSGLAYTVGARVRATDTANTANWMEGLVTAYSGTTLTFTADLASGSGTKTSWNINLAGERGATGATGSTGSTGSTGPTGPGYTATSTTSNSIASSGSKSFTTQSGLAYTAGARVRASDTAAPSTNYMEGVVTSYSGTTLQFTADLSAGSGTLTSWNINLAGDRGATGATGPTGPTGPAGSMGGPVSSTDNAVARFDGTSGTVVQNSGVIIDDSNNVSGIATLTTTGNIELGHASDTTISRTGAGAIAVEGVGVALNSTSAVHIAGTIELGAASDTTLSRSSAGILAVEGVTIPRNSLSDTLTINAIELGHASDTTLSRSSAGVLAVEGVVIPSVSSTNTLTNKRVTPRVTSISSSATPTINTDNCDFVDITALAVAITSMTTNLSGTPTNGDMLKIRFKDNGTARSITWGASFEACGVALPTTTVVSKRLTVGFIYDTTTSKWGCVASVQEA